MKSKTNKKHSVPFIIPVTSAGPRHVARVVTVAPESEVCPIGILDSEYDINVELNRRLCSAHF